MEQSDRSFFLRSIDLCRHFSDIKIINKAILCRITSGYFILYFQLKLYCASINVDFRILFEYFYYTIASILYNLIEIILYIYNDEIDHADVTF